jgi:hypothetical protein
MSFSIPHSLAADHHNSGLGNYMFMYASLRGLSAYYNTDPGGLRKSCAILLKDSNPFLTYIKEHFYRPGDSRQEPVVLPASSFSPRALNLQNAVHLESYLQVHWYFCNIETALLAELHWAFLVCLQGGQVLFEAFDQMPATIKPRAGVQARVATVSSGGIRGGVAWAADNTGDTKSNATATVIPGYVTVAVHIRLGDVRAGQSTLMYMYPPDKFPNTWIQRTFKRMLAKIAPAAKANGQAIVFEVFCGDLGNKMTPGALKEFEFCKRLVPTAPSYSVVYAPVFNHTPMQDMAAIAAADHIILTSGTFAWWAGWTNRRGVVIMSSKTLGLDQRKMDYFPLHFIDD